MVFESKQIQWQALNNAKEALSLIKGLESRLEAIIKSEQICINYPSFTGMENKEEKIESDRLKMLHVSDEAPTVLRKAAASIKRMRDIQESDGEVNNFNS